MDTDFCSKNTCRKKHPRLNDRLNRFPTRLLSCFHRHSYVDDARAKVGKEVLRNTVRGLINFLIILHEFRLIEFEIGIFVTNFFFERC